MRPDRVTLGAVLVLSQFTLWLGYSRQFQQVEHSKEYWGRITSASSQKYYLVSALVAYVLNLGLTIYLIADEDAESWQRYTFAIAALVYYLMQFFFLPMLKDAVSTGDKTPVRWLLGLCVIPIAVCAYVGMKRAVDSPLGFGSVFAGVGAVVPLLHVALNDFALFGFRF